MADTATATPIPHCLFLLLPLQGHINPMLQFAKRLQSKGLSRITLVFLKSFLTTLSAELPDFSFPVEFITNGYDDIIYCDDENLEEYLYRTKRIGSESLSQLLEKLRSSGSGADCLIYNAFFPWALDVAKKFGLTAAVFLTQSNAVNSVYYHASKGDLKLPLSGPEIRVPGFRLPDFGLEDMPSFIRDHEKVPLRTQVMLDQFVNIEQADWILVNTFLELEHEVCEWMAKIMPMRPIGPTIPSMYTDQRIPDDKEYGLNAFTPVTDPCTEWLDKNDVGSVIYASFGSFARPGAEQFRELALALKSSPFKFLWVVRKSEESKVPQNYKQETSDKGLIVPWCNQLDVLAHAAIGCFVTHCGWNSTLEALNSGVPMVAVPQWSDQFTNAKFVKDVWKVGVRAKEDEKGVVRKEEFIRCVKHVMEEEMIKSNAETWKKSARKAMDQGGSSDNNIQEFVSAIIEKHAE